MVPKRDSTCQRIRGRFTQHGEALLGEARPQVARDVLVALAPSQHDDRLAGETLGAACRLVEEAAEPVAFD